MKVNLKMTRFMMVSYHQEMVLRVGNIWWVEVGMCSKHSLV